MSKTTTVQTEHSSIVSILCRICYDSEKEEELITPCRCKGTVAFVHRSCLETWLAEANATKCELCHQVFHTERNPRYGTLHSIWRWCKYQPSANELGRGITSDIVACTIITPIAVIVTYICLFSSDYYNQKRFDTIPAARWTSVSLLVMIGIMLIGYYMWVFSLIRLHSQIWYNWWQRECVVTYIPPPPLQVPPNSLASSAPESSRPVTPSPRHDFVIIPPISDESDTKLLPHAQKSPQTIIPIPISVQTSRVLPVRCSSTETRMEENETEL